MNNNEIITLYDYIKLMKKVFDLFHKTVEKYNKELNDFSKDHSLTINYTNPLLFLNTNNKLKASVYDNTNKSSYSITVFKKDKEIGFGEQYVHKIKNLSISDETLDNMTIFDLKKDLEMTKELAHILFAFDEDLQQFKNITNKKKIISADKKYILIPKIHHLIIYPNKTTNIVLNIPLSKDILLDENIKLLTKKIKLRIEDLPKWCQLNIKEENKKKDILDKYCLKLIK